MDKGTDSYKKPGRNCISTWKAQRLHSAGKGLLNPPRLFMYCRGWRLVTFLTAPTSFPATGFPFVESNPTGIPNFFIISISSSSIISSPPSPTPPLPLTFSLSLFFFFCFCCSLAIPSTKSETSLRLSLSLSLSLSRSPSSLCLFLGGLSAEGLLRRW